MKRIKYIPISKPVINDEEIKAITSVLKTGNLAQGKKVIEFENTFSKFCGTKYAIAVSSGTAALTLAIQGALNTSPIINPFSMRTRPEVITTPFTFIATANSILAAGGKPIFVDIEPNYLCIDPDCITKAITSKTRAILPVHLYGQPCDMDPIIDIAKDNNLAIIEDACQAHGAVYDGKKTGNLNYSPKLPSSSGCFSFYPTKNMTSGEGGMITTNDAPLAVKLRQLRNHGMATDPQRRYEYSILGMNFRMSDIYASLGLIQLKKLNNNNNLRIKNAKEYTNVLKDHSKIFPPEIRKYPRTKHVFHQYTVNVDNLKIRTKLINYLNEKGIGCNIYYPVSLTKVSHLKQFCIQQPKISNKMSKQVLSIPVHPLLTANEKEFIKKTIYSFK